MTTPPRIFTREQIARMTADEYTANRDAIMAQLKRDGAPPRPRALPRPNHRPPTGDEAA
ncbi:hypothetical protein [Nocardiopsis kunsanensis]|uniref:hypothetical protein n=1 Tax=Nocardiopsis kunsanensis TaxID=141693 RepID=UPI00034A5804|nr:hypothetical protein [Nocardiopsis kunsanensis]